MVRDTLGEFYLRSYLEMGMSREQALAAAEGWGGDSYALFHGPEGGVFFVLSHVWDTDEDADGVLRGLRGPDGEADRAGVDSP